MKKLFALLVISAGLSAAQPQERHIESTKPAIYPLVINSQLSGIMPGIAFPMVQVMIIDPARADGYLVTVEGLDVNSKAFSITKYVATSGQPATVAAFAIDAQNPLTRVEVIPMGMQKNRAVTAP